MSNISSMSPGSGRIVAEDDSIINVADLKGGTDFTFHNGTSPAGNGNVKVIKGEKTLRVGVKSNTTNSVIECHGIDAVGNDELLKGYDRAYKDYDSTTASSITLEYDVSAYKSVYFKTVANNIKIIGTFVS